MRLVESIIHNLKESSPIDDDTIGACCSIADGYEKRNELAGSCGNIENDIQKEYNLEKVEGRLMYFGSDTFVSVPSHYVNKVNDNYLIDFAGCLQYGSREEVPTIFKYKKVLQDGIYYMNKDIVEDFSVDELGNIFEENHDLRLFITRK